jgi:hypothetical protein
MFAAGFDLLCISIIVNLKFKSAFPFAIALFGSTRELGFEGDY